VLESLAEAKKPGAEVTWEALVPQIRKKVTALTADLDKDTPEDRRQRPQYIGNFTRDPVLVAAGIAPPAEPKPGEEREVEIADGVKMTFCYIPKGKATLGSPKDEKDRDDDETEHEYEEKVGFWLGKYEVTQVQWEKVMGDNPSWFSATGDRKERMVGLKTDSFPVETVSWDDCQKFLAKVNDRGGAGKVFGKNGKFVLPHEDRWEYAYRGGKGNKTAFYWGDTLNGDKANCDGNYPYGTTDKGEYKQRTTAVGEYEKAAPHPWGLCDMSGNVREWCDNKYSSDGTSRVLRGGSWLNHAWLCRAASRDYYAPDYRDINFGFRVCVVLD